MYINVSDEFLEAVQGDGRRFCAKLILPDGTEITSDDIISIALQSYSGEDTETMQLGTASSSQLDVTCYTDESLANNEIALYIGLILTDDDGEEMEEYIPMGYFTAQKPTKTNGQTVFTAYDRMTSHLSGTYVSELEYPCDISEVCKEIENQTGITFADIPTGITLEKRADSTDGSVVTYVDPFDGYTYQETVAFIAGRLLKFAIFNRDGELDFRYFQYPDEEYTVSLDDSYSDVAVQEEAFTVGYLSCTIDNSTTIQSGDGTTGISLNNHLFTQNLLDEAYEEIAGFSYYPTTVSFRGNPMIDLGDMVYVEESSDNSVVVPIQSLEISFDGGLTSKIGSYGSTEQTDSYVSPTEKALTAVYQDMAVLNYLIVNKKITVGDIEDLNFGDNLLVGSKYMNNEEYTVCPNMLYYMSVSYAYNDGSNKYLFATDEYEAGHTFFVRLISGNLAAYIVRAYYTGFTDMETTDNDGESTTETSSTSVYITDLITSDGNEITIDSDTYDRFRLSFLSPKSAVDDLTDILEIILIE